MKTISIIPNKFKDQYLENTKYVAEILSAYANVLIPPELASHMRTYTAALSDEELFSNSDIILVLGGDGALLSVARRAACYHKPILGVNMGRLGFLTGVEKEAFAESANDIAEGNFEIQERIMLDVCVEREGNCEAVFVALNDAVISGASFSRILAIRVSVDDIFLDSYMADGVVTSTPTGSTAYALSAGGPVIEPTMDVCLIAPICPHDLRARPVVISGERTISLEILEFNNREAGLTIDGQEGCLLSSGDKVIIKKSPFVTRLAKVNSLGFYELLRRKL